jgi:uncharacterized protein YecT (DUF1311 family)
MFGLRAYAQQPTKEHKIDIALSTCIKKDGSTIGMISCLITANTEWEKELNRTFKLLLSKLDTSDQRRLRESQRQWITYRDKEILFFMQLYDRDGTMWNVIKNETGMKLTRQRAIELLDYYETISEN